MTFSQCCHHAECNSVVCHCAECRGAAETRFELLRNVRESIFGLKFKINFKSSFLSEKPIEKLS
jgi:hypothetical protein